MDTSSLLQFITNIPPEYWYGVIFLGTFLLGENVIIAAFVFTATHPSLFPITFLMTLCGTLAADIFWYLIAIHVISKTRLKNVLRKKSSDTTLGPILRIADHHPYLLLLGIKFLAGIRLFLSLSIITRTRLSFRQFLFFDTLGATIFIALLSALGWFASTRVSAVSVYSTITTALIATVTLSLALHILSKVLPRILTKK